MSTERDKLVTLVTSTFTKGAWHGDSVMEVLQKVKPEDADKRFPNTHSIIELVAHMVSWRSYVIKKLSGDDLYKVDDENNFPIATSWHHTIEQLEETQAQLLQAVAVFDENKLSEIVPHTVNRYTYYTLIHGIIHHDVYHLGQISLLLKSGTQTF